PTGRGGRGAPAAGGRGGRGRGGPVDTAAADFALAKDHYLRTADEALEARVPIKAGARQVLVTVVKSSSAEPEGLAPARLPIWSHSYDGDENAQLVVSAIVIGGPYNGVVPKDSASRRRIFVCSP